MAIKYIHGLKKENKAGADEYFFIGDLVRIKQKYDEVYEKVIFGRIKHFSEDGDRVCLDTSKEFESRYGYIYINEIVEIDHVWTTERNEK